MPCLILRHIDRLTVFLVIGEGIEIDFENGIIKVKVLDAFAKGEILLEDEETGKLFSYRFNSRFAELGGVIEYEVTGRNKFYFSHDATEFDPADLIKVLKRRIIATDGTVSDWSLLEDYSGINMRGQNPEQLYDEGDSGYVKQAIYVKITGELPNGDKDVQEITLGSAYVALKGDVNLDRSVNARDANWVLIHAAKVGTASGASYVLGEDSEMQAFREFLADVKPDGSNDAKDANAMLIYAAKVGTGNRPDWSKIVR